MKKVFLLLLVVIGFHATGYSQMGLQIGWNTSGYRYVIGGVHETRGWNWGFNGGLLFRTPGKRICFQPTLLYTQKGATNNNDGATYTVGVNKYVNKLNYVEFSVPILFKAPFAGPKNSFDIGIGPYAAKLVSAYSKIKYLDGTDKNSNFKVGNGSKNDFTPLDFGLSFYMGARFTHFFMSLGYDKGISNVDPRSGESIKNGCFNINMGVLF